MYAKLFSRITESSLMEEPVPSRYVFMMMLAISDPKGYVIGTDIAISRRLNLSVDEFKKALVPLMLPDPHSNSRKHEGRRVIPSDGERGYYLVNYTTYRDLVDEDNRRAYMREYMREYRAKEKGEDVNLQLTVSTQAEEESKVNEEEPPSEVRVGRLKKRRRRLQGELLPLQTEATQGNNNSAASGALTDAWNKCSAFPSVRVMTPDRMKVWKTRMTEPFFREHWREALERLCSSDFCKGQNDRAWKADIDWFLRPGNVARILEGKYDARTSTTKTHLPKGI